LHDTAAHSLPDGADTAATVTVVPAAGVGWESIAPGTRQLTTTAATVTRSQRHLVTTMQG